jgi:cytochrome c
MLNNTIFWDMAPYGFRNNQRFGWTYRFHRQGEKIQLARNNISNNVECYKCHMVTHPRRRHSSQSRCENLQSYMDKFYIIFSFVSVIQEKGN